MHPSECGRVRMAHTCARSRGTRPVCAHWPRGSTAKSTRDRPSDRTVRKWSGDDGAHLRTLVGHTTIVLALAVGVDGTIYSVAADHTIRAWSGENGAHLRTLVGHTDNVNLLAVGLDGKVYSGSTSQMDNCVHVWSPDDGALLNTLEVHNGIFGLAVGPDGSLFSSSTTINVLSGETGHLHTLKYRGVRVLCGVSLSFGRDGALYSGLSSEYICVWR
jgi:WD40 repeat protein